MWIMTFHSVGNFIIPTGPNSYFFRGVGSTTNQIFSGIKRPGTLDEPLGILFDFLYQKGKTDGEIV